MIRRALASALLAALAPACLGPFAQPPATATAWHVGGAVAVDLRSYGRHNVRDSGPALERAVVRIEGAADPGLSWRAAADLRGTDVRYGLEEAWIRREQSAAARVTAALIDVPLGFDASLEREERSFLGPGFSTQIDGRTDFGVRFDGELDDGTLYYDLAGAAGAGFDRFGERREGPQISARLVAFPFRGMADDAPLLAGLFAGAAIAFVDGYRGEVDLATSLRNKLFDTPRLRAASARFLHGTLGTDAGPFRFVFEGITGEGTASGSGFLDAETGSGEVDLDQVGCWEASFACLLTGERYDSRPYRIRETGGKERPLPARPLWGGDGAARGIGTIEAVVGYANADIDRGFFTSGLTTYAVSSQEFRTISAALHWLPRRSLRVTAEMVRTIADQTPAAFRGRGRDTSYGLRLQWAF
jgi:hypothetical protein